MNKCIECLYKLDFYKIGIFICGKHQEIVPYNWKMCCGCENFEKLYLLKGGVEDVQGIAKTIGEQVRS